MKNLFAVALAAMSLTALVSCQRTLDGQSEKGIFDGNWTLDRIGKDTVTAVEPKDCGFVIRGNRLFEGDTETGRIEKEGEQYVMIEKKDGKKYPCELTVLTKNDGLVVYSLTFHMPKGDPDFGGRDVVYKRMEKQPSNRQ